jgi:hypothetical protein
MRDVLYAVRSDETTHRFVNHSLANLKGGDANPFALREPDMTVKGKIIECVVVFSSISCQCKKCTNGTLTGSCRFDRAESERYVNESQKLWDEANAEDVKRHRQAQK